MNQRVQAHVEGTEQFLSRASKFLVQCQIKEPYVTSGTLKGSVCPWEIGVADTYGLTILEDYHDTLEAIWVWSYYTRVSGKQTFKENIKLGWTYIVNNMMRHIPPDEERGLYNCSHLLLCGTLYEQVYDDQYRTWMELAGDRLARYLRRTCSTPGWKSRCMDWWDAACLAVAGRFMNSEWLETAQRFVQQKIIEDEYPFTSIEGEPRIKCLGNHECFSRNANKVLALTASYPNLRTVKDLLAQLVPFIPTRFVHRQVDEHPWNANVAMALGMSYRTTRIDEFLRPYFAIMDELKRRDTRNVSSLPRSMRFQANESWVTFFWAYAYTSFMTDSLSTDGN